MAKLNPTTTTTEQAGVRKKECVQFNEYHGTAEALVAAGIVEMHMLPGQPGMPKTRVRINGKKQRHVSARFPNVHTVIREGKKYRVIELLPEDERERRRAAQNRGWGEPLPKGEKPPVTKEDVEWAAYAVEFWKGYQADILERLRQQEAKQRRRPDYLRLVK